MHTSYLPSSDPTHRISLYLLLVICFVRKQDLTSMQKWGWLVVKKGGREKIGKRYGNDQKQLNMHYYTGTQTSLVVSLMHKTFGKLAPFKLHTLDITRQYVILQQYYMFKKRSSLLFGCIS